MKIVLGTLIVFVFGVAGCASVDVQKIPAKSQYGAVWDDKNEADELQREADKIRGTRYYLPRPYVSVYEPFAVDSKVFLLNGLVSADGKYILLGSLKDRAAAELGNLIQGASVDAKIPAALLSLPIDPKARDAGGTGGSPQSDVTQLNQENVTTGAAPGASDPSNDNEAAPPANTDPESPQAPPNVGLTTVNVTNDNNAFAMTPMRRYFDVAFLPDFDEQYAVVVKPGIGNANSSLALGQGWSLQGLGVELDNSEVSAQVLDLFKFAAETAKKVGLNALGLPAAVAGGTVPVPVAPSNEDDDEAGAQSLVSLANVKDGEDTKPLMQGGQPVTVKITLVDYASPGLYPIMKPREVREQFPNDPANWLKYANKPAFDTFRYAVIEPVVTGVGAGIPISGGALNTTIRNEDPGPDDPPRPAAICPGSGVEVSVANDNVKEATQYLNDSKQEDSLNKDGHATKQWIIAEHEITPECGIVVRIEQKTAGAANVPETTKEGAKTIIDNYLARYPWYMKGSISLTEVDGE